MTLDFWELLFVSLVIVVLIYYFVFQKNKWVELYGGTNKNLGEVQARYSYLKDNGIRCRLKSNTPPPNRYATSNTTSVTLLVYKEDEDKALKLMSEFNRK
ncbi:DUF3343 domain-containing protein [Natranaerofaba carboxydovora]|uniref:DUF3343 domain-containing protein n=1 Tax=Natranaerofaba carboxydovora TaxID=2742683 RepID=UPI001F12B7A6|nr:DUF3343 domain-containing protein [Natranaerofaba carboxydovora]UMZ74374.1 hypothetical protein ACONDI_01962 [Natranaerofaba carboxydovora]